MVRMERSKTSLASAIDDGRAICSIFHGCRPGTARADRDRDGKTTEQTTREEKGEKTRKNERRKTKQTKKSSIQWRRAIRRGCLLPIQFHLAHATKQLDTELNLIKKGLTELNERIGSVSAELDRNGNRTDNADFDTKYGEWSAALEQTLAIPLADELDDALENLRCSEEWSGDGTNDTTILSENIFESTILNEEDLDELLSINITNGTDWNVYTPEPPNKQDIFISQNAVCDPITLAPKTKNGNPRPDTLFTEDFGKLNATASEWLPAVCFRSKAPAPISTCPNELNAETPVWTPQARSASQRGLNLHAPSWRPPADLPPCLPASESTPDISQPENWETYTQHNTEPTFENDQWDEWDEFSQHSLQAEWNHREEWEQQNQIMLQEPKTPPKKKHRAKSVARIVTQNAQGLSNENDDSKLKSIIAQMRTQDWDAVCIQETWRMNDEDYWIEGYKILMHGTSVKQKMGHSRNGVCIILSPKFAKAYEEAGEKKITTKAGGEYGGRFMGINLTFQSTDDNGRKIKGKHLKLFLCSIYHPVDNKEYEEFNNLIPSLTARCPRDAEMIFCHDINCNVGISSTRGDTFRETVGPYGLNNRNKKGHELLQMLASHDMKITNSYFRKESHTTWKSFNSLETQHMLDVISTSSTLFKRVLNCGVSKFGIDKSDHSAVEMKLDINSIPIRVKAPTLDAGAPDWTTIMEKEDTNATYNEKTRELSPSSDPNYTSFFQAARLQRRVQPRKSKRGR